MAIAPEKLKRVPDRLVVALYRAGVPADAIRQAYCLDAPALARALAHPPEPLKIEDLDLLPDNEYRYELREGELVRMSPSKRRHSRSAGAVAKYLGAYLVQHPLGELCVAEGGFRSGPNETLYCPDVAYVSEERAATVPPDEYYPFAPDIAVEAWSPDNTEDEMNEKAANYLAHGARAVWLLRPQDRTVRVHRSGRPVETLQAGDLLTGDEILPGFSVPVSDLFAAGAVGP